MKTKHYVLAGLAMCYSMNSFSQSGYIVADSMYVKDTLKVDKKLIVEQDAVIKGTLKVTDKATFKDNAVVQGNLKLKGLAETSGNDRLIGINSNGKVKAYNKLRFDNSLLKINADVQANNIKVNRITAANDSVLAIGDSTIFIYYTLNKISWTPGLFGAFGGLGIGNGNTISQGTNSIALGTNVRNTNNAEESVTIGSGVDNNTRLDNTIKNTLMVGFNSDEPTFFVGTSSGAGTTGKVGVGTTNPTAKLDIVNGTNNCVLHLEQQDISPYNFGMVIDANSILTKAIAVRENGIENFTLYSDGTAFARQIKVTLGNFTFPDYVFNDDYNLRDLKEVESYIKKHNHLPDVPSAKEVEKEGINLAEMDTILLKKIEELTLYMIELKKENDQLKRKVEQLEK